MLQDAVVGANQLPGISVRLRGISGSFQTLEANVMYQMKPPTCELTLPSLLEGSIIIRSIFTPAPLCINVIFPALEINVIDPYKAYKK